MSTEITVEVWSQRWKVTGSYFRARRGYCEPGGGQIDPDEPEQFEIHGIQIVGIPLDLDDYLAPELIADIEAACIEECQPQPREREE